MSDKKTNVELTDLAAEGAEDVKGGAAAPAQSFANINVGKATNLAMTSAIRAGGNTTINPGDFQTPSTVMCPW